MCYSATTTDRLEMFVLPSLFNVVESSHQPDAMANLSTLAKLTHFLSNFFQARLFVKGAGTFVNVVKALSRIPTEELFKE